MQWLLGGGTAAGLLGVVALAIYIAKMASNNRKDLHKLVQSVKDLSDARRDNDGYKRNVEERDNAITALQRDLEREGAALVVARTALAVARKRLVASGDPSSVAADLNGALERLSEMSAVPTAEAPEGGDD